MHRNDPVDLQAEKDLAQLTPPVETAIPMGFLWPWKLCVLVACDTVYLREHAVLLAQSLADQSPGIALQISLVDPAPGDVQLLESLQQRTGLRLGCRVMASGLDPRGKPFRTLCASIRFVEAWRLLRSTRASLLCLDADTLVRGRLNSLRRATRRADVAMRLRPEMEKEKHRVAAGTVYLRNSHRSRAYLRDVALGIGQGIQEREPWYLDQRVLYRQWQAHPDLRMVNLPTRFADWEFSPNSVLWAGKGERKSADPRYVGYRREVAQRFKAAGIS